MKRIEAADLARMGATESVINFYNGTDPMHIVFDGARYVVSGVFDFTAGSEEDLLGELSSLADACEEC